MFLENPPTNNEHGISDVLSSERCCDLCNIKKDLIDLAPCPTGNGYYCDGCIKNGDVESYLRRSYKYKDDQITKFLNSIKF